MQFIYDNLTASVISGTVVLILFTVQMRAMNTSIAQTSRNIALNSAQTFATWLEQDLQRVGRNREEGEKVITELERETLEDRSPTGHRLSSFSFKYGSGGTTITYEVDPEDRTIGGQDRTVYQLTRQEGSDNDGQGPPTLGYFDLQFVDEDSRAICPDGGCDPENNRDDIRAIRVHFSVIPPFQNEESTLEEVHRMVVVPYTPSL